MKKILLIKLFVLLGLAQSTAQIVELFPFDEACQDSLWGTFVFSGFTADERIIVDWGDNSEKDTIAGDAFDVFNTYSEANPSGYDITLNVIDQSNNVVFDSIYENLAIINDCSGGTSVQPWRLSNRQAGLVNVFFDTDQISTALPGCANDTVKFELFPAYNTTDEITIAVFGPGAPVILTVPGNTTTAAIVVDQAGDYNVQIEVRDDQNNLLKSLDAPGALSVIDCAPATIDVLSFTASQFDTACMFLPFELELVGAISPDQFIAIEYGDGNADTVPESNRLVAHTYESVDTFDLFVQVLNNDFSVATEDTIYNAIATFDCGVDLGCTASIPEGGPICLSSSTIELNPTVDLYTNFEWTTDGQGQFDNASNAINSYTPDANDVNISLSFTATRAGCRDTTITVDYAISRPVSVASIDDIEVCGSGNVALEYPGGTMPEGFTWSPSIGSVDNPTSASVTYTSSINAEFEGQVKVYIGDQDNICPNSVDSLMITVLNSPKVSLGDDFTDFNTSFNISGTITGATNTGSWTTSGNGTFGNVDAVSTTYTPSLEEKQMGSVRLTLTSTNNNGCSASSSTVDVLISACDVNISNRTELNGNIMRLDAEFQNPTLRSQGEVVWVVDPAIPDGVSNVAGYLTLGSILGLFKDNSVTKPQTTYCFRETGVKKVYMLYSSKDFSCQSIDSVTVNVEAITTPIKRTTFELNYDEQPVSEGTIDIINMDYASIILSFGVATFTRPTGFNPQQYLITYGPSDNGTQMIDLPENDQYFPARSRGKIPNREEKQYSPGLLYFDMNGITPLITMDVYNETIVGSLQRGGETRRTESIVGNDIIKGNVSLTLDTLDTESNLEVQVIENANITLVNQRDSIVLSTLSNVLGSYELKGIPRGVYKLKAFFLGEELNVPDLETDYFIVDGDSNTIDRYDFRFVSRGLPDILLRTTEEVDFSSEASLLNIYPNPSDGMFTIETPQVLGSFEINVIDHQGLNVYAEAGSGLGTSTTLDLTNLSSGIYFVTLTTDIGTSYSKLAIK